MKRAMIAATVIMFCAGRGLTAENSPAIDRKALVTRHNIEWNDVAGEIPLGNGEFVFNADGTGLQTYGGNTMSHWGWHSAPLPAGCSAADVPTTGTVEKGRIAGPMRKAAERAVLDEWMFQNPHSMNLGRLRLLRADGTMLETKDITHLARKYDLWSGLHTSGFDVDGQAVRVETCVHPMLDLVAVRVESALLYYGRLVVVLDFPYPNVQGGPHWAGNWDHPEKHGSNMVMANSNNRADIHRTADASTYTVSIAWSKDCAPICPATAVYFTPWR